MYNWLNDLFFVLNKINIMSKSQTLMNYLLTQLWNHKGAMITRKANIKEYMNIMQIRTKILGKYPSFAECTIFNEAFDIHVEQFVKYFLNANALIISNKTCTDTPYHWEQRMMQEGCYTKHWRDVEDIVLGFLNDRANEEIKKELIHYPFGITLDVMEQFKSRLTPFPIFHEHESLNRKFTQDILIKEYNRVNRDTVLAFIEEHNKKSDRHGYDTCLDAYLDAYKQTLARNNLSEMDSRELEIFRLTCYNMITIDSEYTKKCIDDMRSNGIIDYEEMFQRYTRRIKSKYDRDLKLKEIELFKHTFYINNNVVKGNDVDDNDVKVKFDTHKVINMKELKYKPLISTDLSKLVSTLLPIEWNEIDTSAITDMSDLFRNSRSLTDLSAISGWDVSNVINMSNMFRGCENLIDLSPLFNWNVRNVTTMYSMFTNSSSIIDLTSLSKWNVEHVRCMSNMFYGCTSLVDLSPLSSWKLFRLDILKNMFSACPNINFNSKQMNIYQRAINHPIVKHNW